MTLLRDKQTVRIPLDYYRILGLPIQATPEQLEQAYCDRTLQLPRREYSDSAIQSRKQLLEEAYQILSIPEKREDYDLKFLAHTYDAEGSHPNPENPVSEEASPPHKEIDSYSSYIEIPSPQFLGSLLILHELGEYELVLQLAEPHLINTKDPNETIPCRGDLVLVTTLSYLELARELWQQREYEKAATCSKIGLELLLAEDLFLNVQREIQNDLYKLRPYRILELVTQPLEKTIERTKGIQLLQDMLDERHGIDGKGNDRSGLNIEDFLQFIQQLRLSLTTEEQQELFEMEAQRPSAVGAYLAVYAFIARGFSEKRPAFILRAQDLLINLGQRQDVYLERAICALLLGKTEDVNEILEQSKEDNALKFIQEKSQGSVDLLPGLCVYTENWLTQEVFSQFRDLIGETAVLEEYFADHFVQRYLEQLYPSIRTYNDQVSAEWDNLNTSQSVPSYLGITESNLSQEYHPNPSKVMPFTAPPEPYLGEEKSKTNFPLPLTYDSESLPNVNKNTKKPSVKQSPAIKSRKKASKPKLSPATKRLFVFLGFGLLGIGVLALSAKLFPQQEEPVIYLHKPLLEIPKIEDNSSEKLLQTSKNLDKFLGETIIKLWLNSKAQSFGKDHKIDSLATILAPSLLKQWESRANNLKNSNSYYEYEHEIKVISVTVNPKKPQTGTIEAEVKESAKFYQNGTKKDSQSYKDDLIINYDVAQINNQWLITDINLVR